MLTPLPQVHAKELPGIPTRRFPRVLLLAIVAAGAVFASSGSAQTPESSYAQLVLTNKPLAYWRLNETADPTGGAVVAADAAGGKARFPG